MSFRLPALGANLARAAQGRSPTLPLTLSGEICGYFVFALQNYDYISTLPNIFI